MTRRMTITSLTLLLLTIALPASAQQEEEDYKNLTMLPEDISADSLQTIMRAFSSSMGVRCSYCHVQKRGTRDYASDDKATKHITRSMMRLTDDINAALRAEGGDGIVPVDCVTCHHGVTVPRTLQTLLLESLDSGGIDAALERYRQLREEYHGRSTYDFGERSLCDVANTLSRGDDEYAAIEFLRLNLSWFPESTATLAQLAGSLHRIGALDEARMRLEEALRLDPDDRYAKRQLQELFGG
mgnify:CR=1 FL=1